MPSAVASSCWTCAHPTCVTRKLLHIVRSKLICTGYGKCHHLRKTINIRLQRREPGPGDGCCKNLNGHPIRQDPRHSNQLLTQAVSAATSIPDKNSTHNRELMSGCQVHAKWLRVNSGAQWQSIVMTEPYSASNVLICSGFDRCVKSIVVFVLQATVSSASLAEPCVAYIPSFLLEVIHT